MSKSTDAEKMVMAVRMQKELPVRKHPRLKGFDYNSNGAYFITFCVKDRHEMLGRIVGRDAPGAPFVELSEYGKTIYNEITETPLHYKDIIKVNAGMYVLQTAH